MLMMLQVLVHVVIILIIVSVNSTTMVNTRSFAGKTGVCYSNVVLFLFC